MSCHATLGRAVLLAGLAPLGAATAQEGAAYLRTVEGYAEHALRGPGGVELVQAALNTPLAGGDRLSVPPGSRLEVVLADGSVVRVGGGSELAFAALARTVEQPAGNSILDLQRGDLQLTRSAYAGPETLEVRLGGAGVYLEAPGVYRLGSDGAGSAWMAVREGFAEVATRRGSLLVRSAEMGWIRGGEWPEVELSRAVAKDELEFWADELDAAARWATVPYVEPELAYAAAPLAEHGGWVEVSGRHGWQPYAAADWRPYDIGSWSYTPAGLAWVSAEPWGWVTSHYGSWDHLPGFGWLWFPGDLYAPAWVYWYWGPTHVGWVPAGYYLSAYASYGYVPWQGVYGWTGGSWTDYSRWSFCELGDFGRRGHRGRYASGADLAKVTRTAAIPRGLLATDTRALTPDTWRDLGAVKTRLLGAGARTSSTELPDVTRFAVRAGTRDDAGRWFESKTDVVRRAAASRFAARPVLSRPQVSSSTRPLPGGVDWTRPATSQGASASLAGPLLVPRPPYPSSTPQLGRPGWSRPSTIDPRARPGPVGPTPRPYVSTLPAPRPGTAGAPPGPAPVDHRPVVQRVLEDIRSGGDRFVAPPAPAQRGGAEVRSGDTRSRVESRTESRPPSRSASSRKPPRH